MSVYTLTDIQYRKLYKAYMKHSVDDVLLAAGDIRNKDIIDICAGTMRLSERAMKLKCGRIWAVEGSASMLPKKFCYSKDHPGKLKISISEVKSMSYHYDNKPFDMAFCQQAINYWFDENMLIKINKFLKPGGKFIFNTFNKRPPENPVIKEYKINKVQYYEMSQLHGETVYHMQMCNKMAPHYTTFKWISPKTFERVLNKVYAKVDTKINGTTSIYVCETKPAAIEEVKSIPPMLSKVDEFDTSNALDILKNFVHKKFT